MSLLGQGIVPAFDRQLGEEVPGVEAVWIHPHRDPQTPQRLRLLAALEEELGGPGVGHGIVGKGRHRRVESSQGPGRLAGDDVALGQVAMECGQSRRPPVKDGWPRSTLRGSPAAALMSARCAEAAREASRGVTTVRRGATNST